MAQQLQFDLNVNNQAAISAINTFFDAFDAGAKNASSMLDKAFKDKNKIIGIKLEGGKAVAAEMNNMSSIGNRIEKGVKAINGEFGKTPREVANSIRVLRELLNNTTKYKEGTKKLTQEWVTLSKRLKEAKNEAKNLAINESFGRSITGANIAAGLALDAIRALGGAVKNLVQQGIGMEVLMIQLKGFTGSAEAATAAFDQFVKIAQATPFNVKQVAEASKIMMGFGISTEDAIHRVDQLAIVASATGGELQHMARNLGQIQANQRAYTRDLMQFANQGIPIYQMLSEVMGVSSQQVRKLAEDGKIGFNEVAAALDKMTEKGSAFRRIAEEMDATIEARLEALGSAITVTSGKFINAFQEMDKALGGPFTNSLKLVIESINLIGSAFDFVANNARVLAPIFAAVGAAMAVAFGIAAVQNMGAIIAALTTIKSLIMAQQAAQIALNIATAVFNALTGNWGNIAAAAAVAAAATVAYGVATSNAAEEQDELNRKIEEEEVAINGATNAADLHAFSIKNLGVEHKALVEQSKANFTALQKEFNLRIAGAERALGFLEQEAEKKVAMHEAEVERINDLLEKEKDAQQQTLDAAKRVHEGKMEGLKAELQAVRDRYDAELAELDKQSVYAKELERIKRKEIQAKLQAGGLSRKETLELKEQLHQMDTQVRRRELLAEKKREEEIVQNKILEAEKEHKRQIKAITEEYDGRIRALENAKATELQTIKDVNREIEGQRQLVADAKAAELKAIYDNKKAAIDSLNDQIAKANDLRTAMVSAYQMAQRAQAAASRARSTSTVSPGSKGIPNNFAGGPISGGQKTYINEMGQEAFLSASGKLSMINAAPWSVWKAPSSGTIIPAHLTKQLDIPSGGVNINKQVGSHAAKGAGSLHSVARAIQAAQGGDTYNQNVTVQSDNPTQTANNMMVNMLRQRRMRRR